MAIDYEKDSWSCTWHRRAHVWYNGECLHCIESYTFYPGVRSRLFNIVTTMMLSRLEIHLCQVDRHIRYNGRCLGGCRATFDMQKEIWEPGVFLQ